MDNFKIIYRILRILEKAMDLEEFVIQPTENSGGNKLREVLDNEKV